MPKQKPTPKAWTLSRYFLLYPDATDSRSESVDDYELSEDAEYLFFKGQRVDPNVLMGSTILLNKGTQSDCLGNPLGWNAVSMRLAEQIRQLCGESVQIVPFSIIDSKGVKHANRYCVINPLTVVDAIANKRKRKERIPLMNLLLREANIPEGLHVFRLLHQERTIVVSSAIIKMIQDNEYTGFAASPLDLC